MRPLPARKKRNAETDYITSIQQFGYKRKGTSYSKKSLPPVTFSYQEQQWKASDKGLQWDSVVIKDVAHEDTTHAPVDIGPNYQWVDLWSEGISGILTEQADGWFYKSNLGGGNFTAAEPVVPKPSFLGLSTGKLQLHELESDGRKFITSLNAGAKGYFEIGDNKEWKPFQPFRQLPNIDLTDPNTRFIDLNGDGKVDLIVSEENVFTWYPNLGVAGYDTAEAALKPYDEEKGAAVVFSDQEQRIYLVDMNGDGLTDIVRISNSDICYWPNLGYGRFGAKVSMSNAPIFDTVDHFNPAYLHLADISGTGATDILYLGRNEGRAWLNLSGNGWSETVVIDPFFNTELPNKISVIDFLGNGTASIVWSSPLPSNDGAPMCYIDLMGGKKPYILSGYQNNMGKEVSWVYQSSTYYYLEDKKAGKPWITKLPFPVQCVSKLTINDCAAGTSFSSSYSYHHGYYDQGEREFRGFGKVEQTDSENFDNWQQKNNDKIDARLYQPPVKTITWFHTGAFMGREKILSQFEEEYWYHELQRLRMDVRTTEPQLQDAKVEAALHLKDKDIIVQLSSEEWKEALRACKRMTLRQEVFVLDAPANATKEQIKLQLIPYSVSTHNCRILLQQPKLEQKHAVYTVQESEALSFYNERDTADPRIAHTLNLSWNEYGQVLHSAAVVYGRKKVDVALPAEMQQEQSKSHIIYTVNDYTNYWDEAGVYRLPLPAETKTYELTGATLNGEKFSITDLSSYYAKASEIRYEEAADTTHLQRRLLEQARVLYLKNDLKTALSVKVIDSLAFPYQQYKLAFTPSLVTHLYQDKVTEEMLKKAHYTHLADDNWWIPSGTTVYINEGETTAEAQKRFYLPVAIKDVFGNETSLTYDAYILLLKETEDELHNKASVEAFDYRTLSPLKLKDLNGNCSEVITDELGMVIATSVYKEERSGRHGDEPLSAYSILQQTSLDEVITQPHKFLQKASVFFYYDLNAWINKTEPVCFASIVRETHVSDLKGKESRVFRTVGYSSGLGQNLQTKVQAEKGKAKQWVDGKLKDVEASPIRWVGTGRTIFNNKGNPVKQYEPFFSTTYAYETEKELVEIGYSPLLFYDGLGRNIRVEHPNGTLSRVEFDAWMQKTYDENDTVLESEWYKSIVKSDTPTTEPKDPLQRAAWLAARHATTPTEAHLDSLGRIVLTIADNGTAGKYSTRMSLDIENNQKAVIDARGNTVFQFDYDMTGRSLHQHAMDSRNRWIFMDVMNKPVYEWDSRNHRFRTAYDALHRPVEQWIATASVVMGMTEKEISEKKLEQQIGLTVYGEGQSEDKKHNLRGKVYQIFDQSGLMQTTDYDFRGNPIISSRRLAKEYKNLVDWNVADRFVLLQPDPPYASAAHFNALNNPIQMDFPDGSKAYPVYNEANLLEALKVFISREAKEEHFIQNIDYNAKGQRGKILYGNNTLTTYPYDEKTYRLTRLRTTRNKGADVLQDFNYTYDPVGNITQIVDSAQQTIFFNENKVDPGNQFEYDALYRLVYAKGREHAGQNLPCDQFDADKMFDSSRGQLLTLKDDMNAMQYYQQYYKYDEVGNILKMKHIAGKDKFENRWTRTFDYNLLNNQLIRTEVNGAYIDYQYDEHGNIKNLQKGSFNLIWNYADQLQQVDLGGGGIAYYIYDSSGQRVRKVIETKTAGATRVKERIYLGAYEQYREQSDGQPPVERETLHIMDDQQCIALVETRVKGKDAGQRFLIRYQYTNHLGTACLELDGKPEPEIISYEEYYPFGSTAYQAMRNKTETPKRYRYTGKERDEETGLSYHGARFYAPWLARWTSCDPLGIGEGLNVYRYVGNNPIGKSDPNGTQEKPAPYVFGSENCTGSPCAYAPEDKTASKKNASAAPVDKYKPLREALPEASAAIDLFPNALDKMIRSFYVRTDFTNKVSYKINEQLFKAKGFSDEDIKAIDKIFREKGYAPRDKETKGDVMLSNGTILQGVTLIEAEHAEDRITATKEEKTTEQAREIFWGILGGLAGIGSGKQQTQSVASSYENTPGKPNSTVVLSAANKSRGIWDKGNKERGLAFESMVSWGTALPKNFRDIDRQVQGTDGIAIRIGSDKTIDLTGVTYTKNPKKIYSTLVGYIDLVASFQSETHGNITVIAGSSTVRVLEIGIEPGVASQEQLMQIERAKKYAESHGVILNIRTVR